MPIKKVGSKWKVEGGGSFKTKKEALAQLRAIKASQAKRKKK